MYVYIYISIYKNLYMSFIAYHYYVIPYTSPVTNERIPMSLLI